jgi:DNA-binding response OmpR family regulator
MPDTEGFKTILQLRRFDPSAKTVAITAADEGLHGHLRTATNFGAGRTLQKPFSQSELLAAIGEALAS